MVKNILFYDVNRVLDFAEENIFHENLLTLKFKKKKRKGCIVEGNYLQNTKIVLKANIFASILLSLYISSSRWEAYHFHLKNRDAKMQWKKLFALTFQFSSCPNFFLYITVDFINNRNPRIQLFFLQNFWNHYSRMCSIIEPMFNRQPEIDYIKRQILDVRYGWRCFSIFINLWTIFSKI